LNRVLILILALTTPFLCGGATCRYGQRGPTSLAPVVFQAPPRLDEIVQVVNENTARVRQLHTDSASLSMPGLPALRASLSFEQPQRFRLRAKLFGPELDLGSNDTEFWFWAKANPEPVIYFARYDQLQASPMQLGLPVEPEWIVEALGLVHFDPHGQHEGPFPQDQHRVMVRSRLLREGGDLQRTIVIDARYGWVLEQYLVDSQGRTVAVARASGHRYDAEQGVSLPQKVDVQLPPSSLSFQIEISQYVLNRPFDDPWDRWTRPEYDGVTAQDLNQQPPAQAMPGPAFPPATAGAPVPARIGYRPSYRGYSR
jgi:hypothetical protein